MEEDGVIMPLYWACQEVQAKLQDQPSDESKVIIQSIEDHLKKFEKWSESLQFNSQFSWFNTNCPISRDSLKGLVTVVDFFTYCCINCMHILPDLEKLEEQFPDGLEVIGIHSAKFQNEKSEYQLENAIKRYNIHHPVCNDTELSLWTKLGVTCWPTLLILSPSLVPIHVFIGEGHSTFLFKYISTAVQYFKDRGELKHGRLPRSIQSKISGTSLKYPGKICLSKNTLVISDSGNNRILVTDVSSGDVLHVVGNGKRGSDDGDFTSASFSNPQGVAALGDIILVADTDNHLIREINIVSQRVRTIGGTGSQGEDKEGGRPGTQQPISSPWDICFISEKAAIVAMAGTHQLWMYCVDAVSWWKGTEYPAGTLVRIVGSGAEENRNNSYPAKAGLAQPSGLSFDSNHAPVGMLYVADSESSTVRKVDLKDGSVKNVCGGERDPTNLFAYGDVEGAGVNAKLQHPLAVAWNPVRCELYVADSYNHKIKKVFGSKNDTVTLIGSEPGDVCGPGNAVRLCEPGGLCVSEDGNVVYLADTNNHAIKMYHLDQHHVSLFDIKFAGKKVADDNIIEHKIDIDMKSGREIVIKANLSHPDLKLNDEGKSTWSLEPELASGPLTSELEIPFTLPSEEKSIILNLRCKMYLCSKTSSLCLAKSVVHRIVLCHVNSHVINDVVNLGSLIQL